MATINKADLEDLFNDALFELNPKGLNIMVINDVVVLTKTVKDLLALITKVTYQE